MPLRSIVERRPVLSFVILCYAISWSIWFAIPLVAGTQWTLIKIAVGIGMGPGLAAVLLDRLRYGAAPRDGAWWLRFSIVTAIVAALNVSSLLTGDARPAGEFAVARAPGVSALGIVLSILCALVCGFVFASAANSGFPTLRSIASRRAPLRWWLVAALLVAALLIASYVIAVATQEEMPDPIRGGLPLVAWLGFVTRAILFTFLVVGIGEEPGWRGWMLPHLLQRRSPLTSSIIVGVVWGLWHFPLFVIGAYPGAPDAVLEYMFFGPLLAILFTWLFQRSGGNLLLAVVFHTAFNNTPRLLPAMSMFPVLLTMLIVALVFRERMWRYGLFVSTTTSDGCISPTSTK